MDKWRRLIQHRSKAEIFMKYNRVVFSVIIFSLFTVLVSANPKKVDDITKSDAGRKPSDRPSVALVLAGGGARGFALLPIIEHIEQMGIPVDMIIGTSIGSIIGGFYSAGYTADEILEEVSKADWSKLFADRTSSPYESVYGIHGNNQNPLAVDFGKNLSIKLGKGISNGQNVYELFKSLSLKIPSDMDFNDLHIPFRSVTVDMLTGDAYVLGDGDLAEAIRASMSLPTVFEPMYMDDFYFVDGGLRYNLAINVAKSMGYDIIIGIDISPHIYSDPEQFNSNPTVALMNMINMSQFTTTVQFFKDADLIITPDLNKYEILDFQKADEIYEQGRRCLEDYSDSLEKIRQRIYPEDYDANGKRRSEIDEKGFESFYSTLDDLVPSDLLIEDAYDIDVKLIEKSFSKIENKPLDKITFNKFIKEIYQTGNYENVRPRMIKQGDVYVLKLFLMKKDPEEIRLLLGTDFKLTATTTNSIINNLELDLQLRGFTGIGSLIALHGTFLSDLGGELYYLQPFSPNIFMNMRVNYLSERYNVNADDIENFSSNIQFNTFGSYLDFGFRSANKNLITIGGFYKFIRNSILAYRDEIVSDIFDELIAEDPTLNAFDFRIVQPYFGGTASFNFGFGETGAFISRGMTFSSTTKFIVPMSILNHSINPFLLTEKLEIRAAIPFTRNISLSTSGVVGTELLGNFRKNGAIIAEEGFSCYDRIYFPSVTSKERFGTNLAAIALCLQFKPAEHLTILGGDLIFRLESTLGTLNYAWNQTFEQFQDLESDHPILWSETAGVGVKIKNNFGIHLRLGVCSTNTNLVAPLFTLDIGNIVF